MAAAVPDAASNPFWADELNRRAHADALETGIDDADRDDSVIDPDNDLLGDEMIVDNDESLLDDNGVKKVR